MRARCLEKDILAGHMFKSQEIEWKAMKSIGSARGEGFFSPNHNSWL